MMEPLPKFDNPPVIETVLSAQFAQLQKFTNAHGGWFWKQYLPPEWETVQSAPKLGDQFERFGAEKTWLAPPTLTIQPGYEPERLQILRNDNERLIQIQDSRFIYNWRKREENYPSFAKLLPEFDNYFAKFRQFVKNAGNSDLELNQWEVTYVNHIEKGDLWEEPKDWKTIFPGFYWPAEGFGGQEFDGFVGEWHLRLKGELGRLHVSLKHVRVGGPEGREAVALQFTARGAVDESAGMTLAAGFNLGHESIVRSFTAMTSAAAHKHWRRTI